jgi:hypothetical protein
MSRLQPSCFCAIAINPEFSDETENALASLADEFEQPPPSFSPKLCYDARRIGLRKIWNHEPCIQPTRATANSLSLKECDACALSCEMQGCRKSCKASTDNRNVKREFRRNPVRGGRWDGRMPPQCALLLM